MWGPKPSRKYLIDSTVEVTSTQTEQATLKPKDNITSQPQLEYTQKPGPESLHSESWNCMHSSSLLLPPIQALWEQLWNAQVKKIMCSKNTKFRNLHN